ncbi:helix-turn-helix domain-containing protein [Lentzea pudingi]|uniref:helix-turn-helix domain-containing protein n=1 Tax=Lentzea pudingi TaxID=1789439 RepID=UPI00166362E3|nr:AraC family transcriptional regulator [Lentzea pudingi]
MSVTAWRPAVDGIKEAFHASFTTHVYPTHTHDAWTLMVLDTGAVRYELDRHEHGALVSGVTLLPPHVPHDGRSALSTGFRKRVLYLDDAALPADLIGKAVDTPMLPDPLLRHRIHQLHLVLDEPFEAASRLSLITERLRHHFAGTAPVVHADPTLADRLRQLLDASLPSGITLAEAAAELQTSPTHLVRAFSRQFGLPPHKYLTGRRVDLARGHLVDGRPAAEVAVLAGFHDQSHLTRHFRRVLGTSPGRFVR